MEMYRSARFRLSLFAAVGFIIIPLIAIVPMAFTNNQYLKIDGFTFKWIGTVLTDPLWRHAFGNSLLVATSSALTSVLLATMTSELLRKKSDRIRSIIFRIVSFQVAMPIIIFSIALLKWYYILNLVDTIAGLVGAHCMLSFPIALLMINDYTRRFFNQHPNVEAAARIMELKGQRLFTLVVLPNIFPSIVRSFLLAFAISFNEGVIVQMLSGGHTLTISKKLYDGLKFEISPEIAAVSLLLMLVCTIGFIIIHILFKKHYATDKL